MALYFDFLYNVILSKHLMGVLPVYNISLLKIKIEPMI